MGRLKKPAFIACSLLFGILTLGMIVVFSWSNATNFVSHFLLRWDAETIDPDTETYYTPAYASPEETYSHSRETAIAAQADGTVLLKNEAALPLSPAERRVSVFGTGSVNLSYGGTGSGAGNGNGGIDLYTALSDEGFTVNPDLKSFYEEMAEKGYRRGRGTDMNGSYYGIRGTRSYGYSINEIPTSAYPQTLRDTFSDYHDAAIIVISRSGGEGQDLPTSMLAFQENDTKHYLELTEEEIELISLVKNSGFPKVIILLNTLNAFECGFLKEDGIHAALWIGGPGQYGMTAVAEILTGKRSPEGRLPDTFANGFLEAPAMQNYGDNRYTDNGKVTTAAYVAYAEGIYIGYRYYETRALAEGEDWYREHVVYPFGYGLSYTDFVWRNFDLQENPDGFTVSVTVENTGNLPGRDVVEIYLAKPYTDYDRAMRIEKASVELVGYAKTPALLPGESETVSIPVERDRLASYDTYGEHTYLAEAGEYTFYASRDAHTPIFSGTCILSENERFPDGADGFPVTNRFETETYSSLPADLSLLSRSDWEGTFPVPYGDRGTAGNAFKDMTQDIQEAILSTDSLGSDPVQHAPVTSSGEGLHFSDLFDESGKPFAFDDPIWMRVVECMSREELYYLVSAGGGRSPAIESIAKRQSNTSDSPMGLRMGTLFPCYPIQAATWSRDTASEIGTCIAQEALLNEVRGWYAPTCNTHRTPFGGRNFEYYSEDGTLAGQYAAAVVKAAQDDGVFVHLKHFALNDQDTNRGDRGNFRNGDPYNGLCTYASEQTIREIYLRSFRYAVESGGAHGVMTSYNRIGNTWAGGHYGLLSGVLYGEWGLKGLALTDFAGSFGYRYMDMDQGLAAGNSQWLYVGDAFPIRDRTSDEAITAMQRAAKRILYAEASSSRINNQRYPDGTSVSVSRTWQRWQYPALGLYLVLTVLYLLLLVRHFRKKS